jgi:hypothetical protein
MKISRTMFFLSCIGIWHVVCNVKNLLVVYVLRKSFKRCAVLGCAVYI